MADQLKQSFLGTGWGFPPAFLTLTHSIEMVSDEEDIRQSLFLLLSTTPGERIMNPGYGCDLQRFVFSMMNTATHMEIMDIVGRAILLYEPRIKVMDIAVYSVSIDPGILHIVIDYVVIQTNSRSNMVFPFYHQEGTNLI
jgi:uncharacterized protein